MGYAEWLADAQAALSALPPGDVLGQVFRHPALQRTGTWVEFGVASGGTLTRLAEQRGAARLWGFDSFDGLPEAWTENRVGKGAFAVPVIPKIPGAHIVSGLFQETLPAWLPTDPITFVHVDCDIYSSAKCALAKVRPLLSTDGAIIAFDELWDYPGYEKHEIKALYEELVEHGVRIEWIAANAGGAKGGSNERAAIWVYPVHP
jgi:hypothetical protein